MRHMNFGIGRRIYLGFGLLVAVIAGLILFTYRQNGLIIADVLRSDRLARQTSIAMAMAAQAQEFARSAAQYVWDTDETTYRRGAEALERAVALVDSALAITKDNSRAAGYREVKERLEALRPLVKSLGEAGASARRARGTLLATGDVMAVKADQIASLLGTKSADYAAAASRLQASVLHIRIANWRFLALPDAAGIAAFGKRYQDYESASASLENLDLAAFERKLLGDLKSYAGNYSRAFAAVAPATLQMVSAYRDRVLPATAAMLEKLSVTSERITATNDAMYAELKEIAGNAQSAGLWTGLVAIAGGLALAVLIARSITRPLLAMVAAMRRLASGELTTEVPAVGRRDELGAMADAVAVFKAGSLESVRLERVAEEESARADAERRAADLARAEAAREQAIVVEGLAGGLARLSERDLTSSVSGFPAAYRKLEEDFNAAAAALREAMGAVARSCQTMLASSSEVAGASEDMSRRAEQQAASLEETTAAIEEITVTGKHSADSAARAREVVAAAKADAERTGTVVRQTVEAMGGIEEGALQINQIIGVIDEIAFQTNLLALNAGVEAARAGDAGRGFAVVASEVRALAQRSAEAAREIKALIQSSTNQVADGVELVAQTGKALQRIVKQVGEINDAIVDIASGAEQQSTGLQQVSSAIGHMDQATQQNAAVVEQATVAGRALAQEAQELVDLVAGFRLHDGQGASGRRVAA
ncbi:MAG: HAMP domain-containing methyl-accepting chemotaxis protein [Hyphomicrobiaceae bacterium]|nr:HAMP domain-containing methyl-accepting chemotaxis protein [Hyphomicrobiaceae bacterium]